MNTDLSIIHLVLQASVVVQIVMLILLLASVVSWALIYAKWRQLRAVSGHSMGGHGALVIALRNPGRYASVSAFAPIAAPSHVQWGQKAFAAYLGDDRGAWAAWDACELIAASDKPVPAILVDQGTGDPFLEDQLRPELLREACERADQPLELRMQPGYDHSYYFVASFIGEHVARHAQLMR